MSYYKDPSDMFDQRADKEEKTAAAEYAQYKEAQEAGDSESATDHYLQSQHYYESAKENREKADEYEGQSWADLKGK
jgi:hypothetical protein